jgi:hypothetical protein
MTYLLLLSSDLDSAAPITLLFHDSFGKYVGLAFTIPKSVLEALYENSRSPCGSGGIGKSESYKKFGVS